MWSDNDIDNAFRRLDPAEPEPTPFPLDAWLKLEAGLDQAVINRAVRRRLWQFFAAEVAVVALVGLGWSLWPVSEVVSANHKARTVASAVLPAGKSTDNRHINNSIIAGANPAAAPANRTETDNMQAAVPRPAAGASVGTAASIESPATAVAAIGPAREAAGRESHLPLVAALAPSRRFTRAARSYPVDGQLAAPGRDAAIFVEPVAGPAESKAANRQATQKNRNSLAGWSNSGGRSTGKHLNACPL